MSKKFKICICISFLLIGLIILYNLSNVSNKNVIYGGEEETESDLAIIDNIDCTMEQIEKHNSKNDKWVYNNGKIYDLTPILEAEIINSDINIDNILKYFKLTKEQDLSKIIGSIEMYDNVMEEYNKKNPDLKKLEFFKFDTLDEKKINENNTRLKEQQRIFDKFKFVFIKTLEQFSKGIICPSGLKI